MSKNINWDEIEREVIQLAIQIFGSYESAVRTDMDTFKKESLADLTEWVTAAKAGEISKAELADLVAGEKDLLQAHELKRKGVSKVALDRFTSGVMSILTKAITKLAF